ncbi:hypothetical protein RvY_04125 [Ramazzottius varieornatus]|uniref:Uncharacterized protein n=1 Tax=Ramazzottius varieornatus TaxID=947166 RepID=A0A1D1UR82_RAMVA|nr:hypothetical protein RvY_04125 [Ramazzottius varieornatus]
MVQKSWRNCFCELRGSPQMVQLLSEYVRPIVELRAEEESSHRDDQTSQRCQNQKRAATDCWSETSSGREELTQILENGME